MLSFYNDVNQKLVILSKINQEMTTAPWHGVKRTRGNILLIMMRTKTDIVKLGGINAEIL